MNVNEKYTKHDIKRLQREADNHSMRKRWSGWSDAEFCDNCGTARTDARLYKMRVPYYIWEREPLEIFDRQDIEVFLCEVCEAYMRERGVLP